MPLAPAIVECAEGGVVDAARCAAHIGTDSLLIRADVRHALAALPDACVQACITSPPYWHVRDYGVEGQLGLEATLDAYVQAQVEVFAQVRRVLRADGVCWLNIGDGYTSGGRTWRAPDRKNPNRAMGTRPSTPALLKPKDLLGVPWRLALALQLPSLGCPACGVVTHGARWALFPGGTRGACPACEAIVTPEIAQPGWYLRSENIWYRPNCHPESVKDRTTRAHEHVFLLSTRPHYHYDAHAARWTNGRNIRTVWRVPTEPGRSGHVAPFPQGLIETPLKLTTRPGDLVLDPYLGSGTTAVVADRLERRFIGVELDGSAYVIARTRLAEGRATRTSMREGHGVGAVTQPVRTR